MQCGREDAATHRAGFAATGRVPVLTIEMHERFTPHAVDINCRGVSSHTSLAHRPQRR
jgi:hypothetical protein